MFDLRLKSFAQHLQTVTFSQRLVPTSVPAHPNKLCVSSQPPRSAIAFVTSHDRHGISNSSSTCLTSSCQIFQDEGANDRKKGNSIIVGIASELSPNTSLLLSKTAPPPSKVFPPSSTGVPSAEKIFTVRPGDDWEMQPVLLKNASSQTWRISLKAVGPQVQDQPLKLFC